MPATTSDYLWARKPYGNEKAAFFMRQARTRVQEQDGVGRYCWWCGPGYPR